MGDRPIAQKIIPTLMFTGAVSGQCEEAIRSYVSIFDGAKGQRVMAAFLKMKKLDIATLREAFEGR